VNDARREEIRRIVVLIKEAKGILEGVLDQEQDVRFFIPETGHQLNALRCLLSAA
jgi:hypothetical protein